MFTNITHLLCGTGFDEKEIGEAADIYDIPSVTGEWVKACVRLGRLACPKIYHPIPNGLFAPVVAAITELRVEDRKKLYALLTFHGGRVERNFTANTTHLVCGAATGVVYNRAMELKSDKFCIVTPDWFYECLKAQTLIDAKPYHPRLLKTSAQSNMKSFESLQDVLGTKPDVETKKVETVKPLRDTLAKATEPMKITAKNVAAMHSAKQSLAVLTASTPLTPITAEEPKIAEPVQVKTTAPSLDNMQSLQRNTINQQSSNHLKPLEQSMKEKTVC